MAVTTYTTTLDVPTALKWQDMVVEFNRRATETTYRKYARDMLAGRWIDTGVPIVRRASDGRIIDGGNRIAAVIEAGKVDPSIKVSFTVAEGVPDDAFAVIDTGRGRSARDAVVMASNGNQSGDAAPVVTWVWKYRHGNPLGASGRGVAVPTRQEFVEFFLADPIGFNASALRGRDAQRRRVGVTRVCGTFHYLLKTTEGIGPDLAEDFFEKFLTGAGLTPDSHPILQLRNRFISRAFPRAEGRMKAYTAGEQLYLFHRAWRAYCTDESVMIQLPKMPLTNASFPSLYLPQ